MHQVASLNELSNEVLLRILAYIKQGSAESAFLKQTAKLFDTLLTFNLKHRPIVYTYAPIYQPCYVGLPPLKQLTAKQIRQLALSAAKHNVIENVKWLLIRHRRRDDQGFLYTVLDMVCYYGHLTIVQWIVRTYSVSNRGLIMCGIERASAGGRLDVLQYLHALNPNVNYIQSQTFIIAAEQGQVHLLQWILDHGLIELGTVTKALLKSAKRGRVRVVEWLAEQPGGDITAHNNQAVVNAACYWHVDMVKWLVQHGADVSVRGNFPLRNALNNCKWDMVRCLVECGANVNSYDVNSTIENVVSQMNLETMRCLIEHGAENDALLSLFNCLDKSRVDHLSFVGEERV